MNGGSNTTKVSEITGLLCDSAHWFFHANSAHWFVIPTCEQWTLRHYLIHIIFNDLRNTRRMPYGVYCTCGRSFQILTLSFFLRNYILQILQLLCAQSENLDSRYKGVPRGPSLKRTGHLFPNEVMMYLVKKSSLVWREDSDWMTQFQQRRLSKRSTAQVSDNATDRFSCVNWQIHMQSRTYSKLFSVSSCISVINRWSRHTAAG